MMIFVASAATVIAAAFAYLNWKKMRDNRHVLVQQSYDKRALQKHLDEVQATLALTRREIQLLRTERTKTESQIRRLESEAQQLRQAVPSQIRRLFVVLDTRMSQLIKDLEEAGMHEEARQQTDKRRAVQSVLNAMISHRLDEDLMGIFTDRTQLIHERVEAHVNAEAPLPKRAPKKAVASS